MTQRCVPLLLALFAACGGAPPPGTPGPASPADALEGFLDAVREKDLARMGRYFGGERGPASEWMEPERLHKQVSTIQVYLSHTGYRVVEGPMPMPGDRHVMTFRVEFRRGDCVHVQPIDVKRANSGAWYVLDAHLEKAVSPPAACPTAAGSPR